MKCADLGIFNIFTRQQKLRGYAIAGFVARKARKIRVFGLNHQSISNRFQIQSLAGTLGLKIIYLLLSFLSNILLARYLKSSDYGNYAYTIAWLGLLNIISVLGLPLIIVREIAIYRMRSQWDLIRGFLFRLNRVVLLVSVALSSMVAIAALYFGMLANESIYSILSIAAISIPFTALTSLRQSAMQGLNKVVTGQLPELLIRPLLFTVFITILGSLFSAQFSAKNAIILHVVSTVCAFFFGFFLLIRVLPKSSEIKEVKYGWREWISGGFPLTIATLINFVHLRIDTLMLGAFLGMQSVAFYAVASRSAELVALPLAIARPLLMPIFSSLSAKQNYQKLESAIAKTSILLFLSSLPIAILLFLCGRYFLLLFGADFKMSYTALLILTVGQLMNASLGWMSQVSIAIENEKIIAIVYGLSSLCNLLMNLFLIPRYGLEGAAIANCSSLVLSRCSLLFSVRRLIQSKSSLEGDE
ncbi:flippase [Oxynema sp. CENA135]|uniref:flippase n=1 Tax=Oxynema sp. CENA135 TaxID=984206 RepID=UPI00190DF130|nr:flippase [Oxynema sp. CENA135]MBK4728714.1 flippase [Oxynema sp. CENA135]